MFVPTISTLTKLPILVAAVVVALLTISYSDAAAQYTPAPAGSVATETQNIDEPGRTPYQETRSSSASTHLLFSTVLAGRRRVILHASCFVTVDSDVRIVSVSLSDDSPNSTVDHLPQLSSVVTKSKRQDTVFAGSPQYYVEGGNTPEVDLSFDGAITALFCSCRLSGYDIILPNIPHQ